MNCPCRSSGARHPQNLPPASPPGPPSTPRQPVDSGPRFNAARSIAGMTGLMPALMLGLLLLALHPASAARLPVSQVVIVGNFAKGPVGVPVTVSRTVATTPFDSGNAALWPAEAQMRWFFANGGSSAEIIRLPPARPLATALKGRFALPDLQGVGLLTLLSDCGILLMPELSELPISDVSAILEALRPLAAARHFFVILDPPSTASTPAAITTWAAGLPQDLDFAQLTWPRLTVDRAQLTGTGIGGTTHPIGASGAVAALTNAMDAATGPWKTPSTQPITCTGVEFSLSAAQSDSLNLAHICPIRFFSGSGHRLFGSRSRNTVDPEKKYTPINRLTNWTSHSLTRTLSPSAAVGANAAPLWTALRSQAESHLQGLFNDGALVGSTPAQAYFVRCDATTTSALDISNNRVKLLYGMAVLQPSEFQITQITLNTANPLQPLPTPRLIALRPSPQLLEIYYPTTAGFIQTPEISATLNPGPWSPGTDFTGDGSWQRLSFPITTGRRFLRVRTR
ncbi:MAG: phage tail sheath family protein [Verrucomicrobiales bacterium]|nr:phage tail sheath family protein [Verrucomicrobiales bacterium]